MPHHQQQFPVQVQASKRLVTSDSLILEAAVSTFFNVNNGIFYNHKNPHLVPPNI